MTLNEYYQIKADVERELNNTDFGPSVGSPLTIQQAKEILLRDLEYYVVDRYHEGFGVPKWRWRAENTFVFCNYETQIQRINEAYAALSPEDQVIVKLRGDAL